MLIYDESSGGSLVEAATGRIVAISASLDFAEVVRRLSNGSIDPTLADPPSYDDYYSGVEPEPTIYTGPNGGIAEYRPAYMNDGEEDDEVPPRLSVGGQDLELHVSGG